MEYLSNNPWPLMVMFAGIAIVAFLSGVSVGQRIAAVCIALMVGVYFLEEYLISPQEMVESELHTMLSHFKNRNVPAIAKQISSQSPDLATIAEQGLELVDISESFHINSIYVEMQHDGSATATVRANGDVTLRQNGGGTHAIPNYWKTEWKQESDQWRLFTVVRLNPVNGTEMGYFSAQ